MTKEEDEFLLEIFRYLDIDDGESYKVDTITSMFNKFLDSNVCIPKGENRHPYADVFHEWAEDTTKQVQYYDCIWLNSNYLETSFALRIKPSEPVYEWQWCLMHKARIEVTSYMASNNHLTDKEAEEWISEHVNKEYFKPIKIEETKRVRKEIFS